jgi:hypothetical protein
MIKIRGEIGRPDIFSDLVDFREGIVGNCLIRLLPLTVSFFNDDFQVTVLWEVKRLKRLNLTISKYCSNLTTHLYCSLAQLGWSRSKGSLALFQHCADTDDDQVNYCYDYGGFD